MCKAPTSKERGAKRKAYLKAYKALLREERSRASLFGQPTADEPAVRPLVPICLPATAEECAAVVRKLWGGVDPIGNGWAAYPTPTAGGMGDGKGGAVDGRDDTAARWAAIEERVAQGVTVRATT